MEPNFTAFAPKALQWRIKQPGDPEKTCYELMTGEGYWAFLDRTPPVDARFSNSMSQADALSEGLAPSVLNPKPSRLMTGEGYWAFLDRAPPVDARFSNSMSQADALSEGLAPSVLNPKPSRLMTGEGYWAFLDRAPPVDARFSNSMSQADAFSDGLLPRLKQSWIKPQTLNPKIKP